MIAPEILHRLRDGVCAIGHIEQELHSYQKHFNVAGQFHVVGTGFLVTESVVLTNRHVLDDLERDTRSYTHPERHCFLLFVNQKSGGVLITAPRQVRYSHALRERTLDVGLIEFEALEPEYFGFTRPVELDDPRTIRVSEEIAVYGYPHGNALLEKDGRVSRWGPVLQRGWISGISPYEARRTPDEFLLDVRAAEGISGSPVFRPSTGKVFGILHSGSSSEDRRDAVTTTAFAQPISVATLADWLAEFELNRESE